jgi:hypothetical protein
MDKRLWHRIFAAAESRCWLDYGHLKACLGGWSPASSLTWLMARGFGSALWGFLHRVVCGMAAHSHSKWCRGERVSETNATVTFVAHSWKWHTTASPCTVAHTDEPWYSVKQREDWIAGDGGLWGRLRNWLPQTHWPNKTTNTLTKQNVSLFQIPRQKIKGTQSRRLWAESPTT